MRSQHLRLVALADVDFDNWRCQKTKGKKRSVMCEWVLSALALRRPGGCLRHCGSQEGEGSMVKCFDSIASPF